MKNYCLVFALYLTAASTVFAMGSASSNLPIEKAQSPQEQIKIDSAFVSAVINHAPLADLQKLHEQGASINNIFCYENGEYRRVPAALQYASGNCDIPRMKWLLENGAHVNTQDALKQTPLINTVISRNNLNDKTEAVKLLLSYGANANISNDFGKKPLDFVETTDDLNNEGIGAFVCYGNKINKPSVRLKNAIAVHRALGIDFNRKIAKNKTQARQRALKAQKSHSLGDATQVEPTNVKDFDDEKFDVSGWLTFNKRTE